MDWLGRDADQEFWVYEPSIYVYGGVLMAIMTWRLEYSLNRMLWLQCLGYKNK